MLLSARVHLLSWSIVLLQHLNSWLVNFRILNPRVDRAGFATSTLRRTQFFINGAISLIRIGLIKICRFFLTTVKQVSARRLFSFGIRLFLTVGLVPLMSGFEITQVHILFFFVFEYISGVLSHVISIFDLLDIMFFVCIIISRPWPLYWRDFWQEWITTWGTRLLPIWTKRC